MRAVALTLAILIAACSKEPSRWEAAEKRAEAPPAAQQVEKKIEGSKLNAFFPAAGPAGEKRVFTAEKPGYVEAKLKRDGVDVALLSVSEASPDAQAKFDGASDAIDGFPLVTVGNNQSSVLVNRKFQVKVSSKELSPQARKALLATFDLKGIATL